MITLILKTFPDLPDLPNEGEKAKQNEEISDNKPLEELDKNPEMR